jgi:hypothetical protein
MMKHTTEDDLVLYFYGEGRRAGQVDRHLSECAECSALYKEIAGTLALVGTPDAPARGVEYGDHIWQRISRELPERERVGGLAWLHWHRTSLAAAAALLLVVSLAGARLWPGVRTASPAASAGGAVADAPSADARPGDASSRVRLAAIGDHLEQSERVLLDVVNAEGASIDVSQQQAWAAALVDSNRFYRDAAKSAGEADVANLLDELERSLLDIVHGPSKLTAAELDRALVRLDAATLLFKIRVLSDELRERELAPLKPRTTL